MPNGKEYSLQHLEDTERKMRLGEILFGLEHGSLGSYDVDITDEFLIR